MTALGEEIIMAMLFADVLEEFYAKKKTGALLTVVDHNADRMLRFYFENGEINHLAHGPLRGKDCLNQLDNYDLGLAIFCAGMKPPRVMYRDLPMTLYIIEIVKNMGKTIRGIHFTEREKNNA
jgi:hypothetical protein